MTAPYYIDDAVTLYHGDCLEVLAQFAACSVDAVVTDPPYDLTSGKRGGTGAASLNLNSPAGRSRISTGQGGFMGKSWDATGVAFKPETWAECLRVLKPGGYLLSFGGSRTWHRLAVAVEDAGFELRDSIAWLYGQGFPKSQDVSKAIDKAAGAERVVIGSKLGQPGYSLTNGNGDHRTYSRGLGNTGIGAAECAITAPATDAAERWQGWGTALKPAFEPIVVARKPPAGTVAANVQQYGTGAMNIDGCRTATDEQLRTSTVPNDMRGGHYGSGHRPGEPSGDRRYADRGGTNFAATPGPRGGSPSGRWPTNVVLDESQAAELDQQTGILTSGGGVKIPLGTKHGFMEGRDSLRKDAGQVHQPNSGGASRFFPTFRYEAKAPGSERPSVDGAAHPTVKPLDLMRWLVRLVTAPGGLVLDPFAGSGTTLEACLLEGFRSIGIEREAGYLPLIRQRLAKPLQAGFDFDEVSA